MRYSQLEWACGGYGTAELVRRVVVVCAFGGRDERCGVTRVVWSIAVWYGALQYAVLQQQTQGKDMCLSSRVKFRDAWRWSSLTIPL